MLKDYAELSANGDKVKVVSNFHTHNYLCGHAGGSVCDYVKEAVENGMSVLGISDHFVSPLGTYEPYIRHATLDDEYLSQFVPAEKQYGDKIKILKAVEIEYFSGFDGYYKKLLAKLDYLVMGQHEFIMDGRQMNSFCDGDDERSILAYCDNVLGGLDSGYFSVLAHPDLILYNRPEITPRVVAAFDRIVKTAKACGVAVELNANGIRYHGFRYPTDMLVELCKKYDAPVTVSSDAHDPKSLCDEYMRGLLAYTHAKGLNVVDMINLPAKK